MPKIPQAEEDHSSFLKGSVDGSLNSDFSPDKRSVTKTNLVQDLRLRRKRSWVSHSPKREDVEDVPANKRVGYKTSRHDIDTAETF